jgi:hypothetical protein
MMHTKRSARHLLVTLLIALVVAATGRVQARPTLPQENGIAPTYTIYATREGLVGKETANGHIIQPNDRFVALPSPGVLSSYQGHEYQVRITYKDRSVVVPVWDVGPWNIDDDYWSPTRRYSDLPVGVPMAQAAYLEGYNNGLDGFGRAVRAPNGIDIADGTFLIDLGMTRDDWVQVSFLWLGDDPGPGNAANILPPPTDGQQTVPPLNLPPAPANPAPAPANPAPEDTHNLTGPPLDSPQVEAEATAVDNSEGGWNGSQAVWYTANCGLRGEHAWTYSTTDPSLSEHHAIWRPNLPAGSYEVKAYIPPCGRASATRSARYRITHNGQVAEVVLDQEAAAGTWASLGTYEFGGTGAQLIELSDMTNDSEQSVRFDAIAWVPADDTAPPEAQIVSIEADETGYSVSWNGTDDRSGISSYDVQVRQLPDGGWRSWRNGIARTRAWFGPAEGKHFAFRVRARDQAGNEQPWSEHAAMDTTQAAQPVQP